MNLKNKLGKIGSLINAISVVLFAICMILPFDFGSYFVCIFISIGFIMMIAAFEDECNENTRVAGKIASIFAGVYAVLILIVYFTQCTTVLNENLSNEAMKFVNFAGETSIGGIIALEFWCLYFLPISILAYLHFKDNK